MNKKENTIVDLFSGTGAFSYVFRKNKINCVYANDFDESSKDIYDLNFDHKLNLKNLIDVKPSEIPKHNILTGGFPCQPFSIAGKKEGFNDERSNVFWKILEIIDYHKEDIVILENVKNLITHDNKNTFTIIHEELTKRGYYVKYKILNTAEITGIPQHRERIYIVCMKNKELFDNFSLDFEKKDKKNIKHFLEHNVNEKYYYTNTSSLWNYVKDITNDNTTYQYRRTYLRENKSNECPTLTANMGTGGHNVPIIKDSLGVRKLTPRECFNFQGFPSDYKLPKISDSKLYKLSGNAVSIPVVELIVEQLVDLM